MKISKLLIFLFICFFQALNAQTRTPNLETVQEVRQLIVEEPALIPMPQKISWKEGYFDLYTAKSIFIGAPGLRPEALKFQHFLRTKGIEIPIKMRADGQPAIELQLRTLSVPHLEKEAYTIDISHNGILITANTDHGIFNAFQTFQQLTTGPNVKACQIVDWPAFEFRGYMVDVGRNYQSLPQLFEQIEAMARYKLNVFQFHPTEDVAWRLQVKKYPQLTNAEFMTRDKGKFYTTEDLKQLIRFCEERHITFIPEIDMPGHSAAFRRAMGVDMQSEEGLAIVKEIVREFSDTFNLRYLHIGGDEVKITNPDFLPQVIALAETLGRKTIGWKPGGNIGKNTIRQLWMGSEKVHEDFEYIDSRHLYINHMDPFESVATLFERKIGDRAHSDKNLLGGILCLWHDRKINTENDLLVMNPVYPSMITFAERSWLGGGYDTWTTNIDPANEKRLSNFKAFEERMLEHKRIYFSDKAFPYVKQADMVWKLFGPFENKGDLTREFSPEDPDFDLADSSPALEALGGTVILRHFWAPQVKGVLPIPAENTTWYAYRRFWSDVDTTANLWAGFNNLSRSYASNAPGQSTWDDRASKLWFNNKLIDAPLWKNAGNKANLETPLIDEGYEYRPPVKIEIKKGWNVLKVKVPVGRFKGADWNDPVKWMFTAVPFF